MIKIKKSLINIVLLLGIITISNLSWANSPNINKDSLEVIQLIDSARSLTHKNYTAAIIGINEAIHKALNTGIDSLIFKAYRKAGYICEENVRYQDAISYFSKALNMSDKVSNPKKLDIYIDWAIINKKAGDYKETKLYFEKTIELARQIGDAEMEEFAYNGMGTFQEVVSEYDKAMGYYLKSLELAQKRNNTEGAFTSLINMCDLYITTKNYDFALKNADKAKVYAEKLEGTPRASLIKASLINVYGRIMQAKGNFKEALNYYQNALEIYENDVEKSKNKVVKTLLFMAELNLQTEQYQAAEQNFLKCFNYKDFFEFYQTPYIYLNLGLLYQKTNKNDKAIEYYKQSLEFSTQRNFKEIIQKANLGLSQVYTQKYDYKNAYEYLKKANIYADSISNDEKDKSLLEAQYKYDVESSEKEMKIQTEKQIKDIQLKQSKFIFLLVGLSALFIIGFLVYYLRMKSKNNLLLLQKNDEILVQNSRLEKSNEILRQYAYASAHDLKEPLRSISSFVHIIQRRYVQQLPTEANEYMQFVISGVKRMEELLSALLEYSTVASEKQEVTKANSVESAIKDVKDNLHNISTEKNGTIEYSGYLPQVWMSKLHLIQLLQNLANNSMKFTEKPPVINIEGKIVNNEYIISLADNGIGIKAEYGDKIFRLFQRLSRSKQYEGTGIGLAICKHIVDSYNGRIWFESKDGEGTTFFLAFPSTIVKKERDTEGVAANEKEQLVKA